MKKYAICDIGKVRETNQDQAFVYTNQNNDTIGIVCDGMGGHKAGSYASLLAAKSVLDCFIDANEFNTLDEAKEFVVNSIMFANEQVHEKSISDEKFEGMGTTICVVLVTKDHYIFGNVGDSRAYMYHNEELYQVTEDHTLVNVLLKNGKITPDEAINHPNKHVLMYAIGTMDSPQIDVYEVKKEDATILLCSDGIYNLVNDVYMKTIFESTLSIDNKAISLINEANNNGGYDNISVVLLEVNDDEK